ncbi:hypothetical protein CCMSSC00406_0003527 [Pleurotus cornucopiae]|uniref:Uncharacterized protein n=1 Tax=Pleurotus cornucopiae TaxID=5321 RepID=A0ACB7IHY5_PLECO|nr:hypothetical protein CCMSSC00406_0003527 [Pleurotus cornucopiae]
MPKVKSGLRKLLKKSANQPGTADNSSGLLTTASASGKENQTSKLPRKHDFGAQLDALFATSNDMTNNFAQNFNHLHFRPLAPPTMAMRDHARVLWLAFQTKVLGSREAAEATLETDAPLPNINQIKQFVFYAAVTGSSRLGILGVTEWSFKTMKTFVSALWGMLRRHGVQVPTRKDHDQLNQAIQEWAKKDRKINTQAHSKQSIHEQDLVKILTLCLLPTTTSIAKNFMRIQLMALLAFTYQQGTRIGSLVEAAQYEGTGQCLKWGDIEFVVFGWDENIGLAVQSFIKLQWNKGQRMVDSDLSLARTNIHVDVQLMLLALGITREVFETDVLAMHKDHPAGQMPITLKVKASARDKPVWLSGDERKAFLAKIEEKLLKILIVDAPTPLNIISLGLDGTVVERKACHLLIQSGFTAVEYVDIPHPNTADGPLRIEILRIGTHRLTIIQDSKHFQKTCCNNIFTGARQLVLGNYLVYYEQVRLMAHSQEHSPLYLRDVDKLDCQDDHAAARLFSAANIQHAIECGHTALAIFLFIFGEAYNTYQSCTISHPQRIHMVLHAYFFKTIWKGFLADNGYPLTHHYLSQEADDILDILVNGLLALIIIHRNYLSSPFPLLPWTHGSEANEHVFGLLHSMIPEFTVVNVVQEVFKQVAGTAWIKANAIWEVLGYFRGSTPSLSRIPVVDPDLDIDDSLDEEDDSAQHTVSDRQILKDALHAAFVASVAPDRPDLTGGTEAMLNECGLAAAALNIRDLASLEELPDEDPTSLSTIQGALGPILAAISALGPAGQAAVDELLQEAAAQHGPVHAETIEDADVPLKSAISHISQYNLSVLVDERRAHQSKESSDTCRPLTRHSLPPIKATPPCTEPTPRQMLAEKIHETLRLSGINIKGETTPLDKDATGNTANARRAAGTRASALIKSRKLIFVALPLADSLSTARINPLSQLANGVYAVVLHEKKIMIEKVVTLYEQGGEKASKRAWVSNLSSIGAVSWISMQIWAPLVSPGVFRSSTCGGMLKFGLVHSKAFLYALAPKEITINDNVMMKLDATIFNSVVQPLNMKEGLVVQAVKQLMGRKHKDDLNDAQE